jgi:hypothetical protein
LEGGSHWKVSALEGVVVKYVTVGKWELEMVLGASTVMPEMVLPMGGESPIRSFEE